MTIKQFPFQTLDWSSVPEQEHKGETGSVKSQVFMMGDIRIRKIEYSPDYKADHWCSKGHIILCLEGEMNTELDNGRIMRLTAGMTYFVGDDCEAHRSSTKNGCKLFIVD
ncbi:MAG TPA: DHCW motif cupin fold protein [Chitinophagaceae bacterium]|nr:DHCW motif cupin fold protein [Chitinophagaceae bacterium]